MTGTILGNSRFIQFLLELFFIYKYFCIFGIPNWLSNLKNQL